METRQITKALGVQITGFLEIVHVDGGIYIKRHIDQIKKKIAF